MSVPPPSPAAPPKRPSVAKGCGIFAGVIVVLFVLSAVIAGIVGGGKSDTGKTEAKAPAPTASKASPKASSQPAAAPSATKAKPKPATSATGDPCPPTRDVIVWMKVPDLPDSAQVLGNYDQMNCETTFQSLPESSPTGAGYCTEAAWASDNPGYNADATPAPRLKKIQVAVGPAC